MDNIDLIKRLEIDQVISVIFIIISIVSIYCDELIKDGIGESDLEKQKLASQLFLIITIISLIIYIYFLYRNFVVLKDEQSIENYLRFFGSLLFIVGIILYLFSQLNFDN